MTSSEAIEYERYSQTSPTPLELAMYSTIRGLTRGDCWCEMAIGNPMFSTHSTRCVEAQKIVKTFEVAYPEYSERLP